MINVSICSKCPHCLEHSPSRYDGDGKLISLSSAQCGMSDDLSERSDDSVMLSGISDAPEKCPYLLEHQLMSDETFSNYEDIMEEMAGVSGHD